MKCKQCQKKEQIISDLQDDLKYWKSIYDRAVDRIAELEKEIDKLQDDITEYVRSV